MSKRAEKIDFGQAVYKAFGQVKDFTLAMRIAEYFYKQAEKDLVLTKDDVCRIFNLVRELQVKYSATEGCFQEVADVFNEQRKK